MIITFDLLNNSIDYLENSFKAYIQANENGEYGNFADEKNKAKFKVSFVLLCQSVELLLKYKLQTINPALVFENIDQIINSKSKTVNASQTVVRLRNLSESILSELEEKFIIKCFTIRNKYIHYECDIDCEIIKGEYAKLFVIYKKLYKSYTGEDIKNLDSFKEEYIQKAISDLLDFENRLVVFRGEEIPKKWHPIALKEIEFNQKYHTLRDENGINYERIKYSSQRDFTDKIFPFCGDCSAIDGEYHIFGCDLEACPKCGNQLISCECDIKLVCEDELLDTQEYYEKWDYGSAF